MDAAHCFAQVQRVVVDLVPNLNPLRRRHIISERVDGTVQWFRRCCGEPKPGAFGAGIVGAGIVGTGVLGVQTWRQAESHRQPEQVPCCLVNAVFGSEFAEPEMIAYSWRLPCAVKAEPRRSASWFGLRLTYAASSTSG